LREWNRLRCQQSFKEWTDSILSNILILGYLKKP
jgi:hypothetical protein